METTYEHDDLAYLDFGWRTYGYTSIVLGKTSTLRRLINFLIFVFGLLLLFVVQSFWKKVLSCSLI